MNLDNVTEAQLRKIKSDWFDEARTSGILGQIATTARTLGKRLSAAYGPKYRWTDSTGMLSVYVDDYGNYMDVHYGEGAAECRGKLVVSTHPTKQLYVPGEWFGLIEPQFEVAAAERTRLAQESMRQTKMALLRELCLID